MALTQNSLYHGLIFSRGESGEINSSDTRMFLEMLGQRCRVLTMPVHSHSQRFDSAQDLMCFPWTQHATHKFHHPDQSHAVGFVARHGDAAHCVRVSAQKFRGAVYHDVSTVLQRLAEIRRRKSVVDDQAGAKRARDLGTSIDVTNLEQGIRDCFGDEYTWLNFICFHAQSIKVAEISRDGFDPEGSEDGLQQIRGRTIEILRSQNGRAWRQLTGKQSRMQGRHPGRIGTGGRAVFSSADRLFQNRDCWISIASVDIARQITREDSVDFFHRAVGEGSARIDRCSGWLAGRCFG